MERVIFWLLTIFCVWDNFTEGVPLRISQREFQHLNEEKSFARQHQPSNIDNEETGADGEMTVAENVRRMQGNRNR